MVANQRQEENAPKEKITSRISILGSGSDWTDKEEGSSLATTATIATISRNDDNKIQQVINLDVREGPSGLQNPLSMASKVVNNDIQGITLQADLQDRDSDTITPEDYSLASDTVAQEDHIDELLNQAVIETTVEDFQSLARKRPKGLLLGKIWTIQNLIDLKILTSSSFQNWKYPN